MTLWNKKIVAFTLAEVLIVIGIIGMVAQMTIPTLMNNVQDQTWKSSYKVEFSEITQASTLIAMDNGGSLAGVFTDAATILNLYSQKLKVIKTTSTSCTLANGAVLNFSYIDTNCNNSSWGAANFGQNLCTEIYLDINGDKKPNANGKDNLWIGIKEDGSLLPAGSPGIINASYKCPGGVYCNSYKYLYDQ